MKSSMQFSIKWRLTLVIFAVAVGVAVGVIALFTIYDAQTYKVTKLRALSAVAGIISENSTPSLSFNDRDDADTVLRSLVAWPTVRAAYLFSEEAGLLAEYLREGETLSVPVMEGDKDIQYYDEQSLVIYHPIILSGKRIGSLYLNADFSDLYERRRQSLIFGAIISTGALLFSFILALLLQRQFTKPIKGLSETLEYISSSNDYTARANTNYKGEFGELALGFNHMLEEIDRQGGEIKKHMALLEHSNKELDQFVYVASHDLKAPLRAVDNLAQLINKAVKDVLPPDKQEFLTLLHGRIKRMERLLDDLLLYSRVGRMETKAEQVNTQSLLRDVIDLMKPPEGFKVIVPDGMPVLRTVRTPLEQVFRNLIGNAIKHHPRKDGKITIGYNDLGNLVEFSVCDDGEGIDPQYHEKIFQMFQTLKPRDEVEGSGMGLAMVKKIVEDQKGEITVRSAPGEGSCFIFTWPKKI